jgi:hypothetical protein
VLNVLVEPVKVTDPPVLFCALIPMAEVLFFVNAPA